MRTRSSTTKRKADLRKKNVGLLDESINIDGANDGLDSKPNKILFGDDFVASDYESDRDDSKEKDKIPESNDDNEGSSSDDEVEQVAASTAKQQVMELFAAQRKTRKEEKALVAKRKRKAKDTFSINNKKEEESDKEDDEMLDDDFFALVDEERKSEAKSKKLKRKNITIATKMGRHTTFVSDIDHNDVKGSIAHPISAEHGIQVVVLPNLNSEDGHQDKLQKEKYLESLTSSLGTEPSKTALLYCRGNQALQNTQAAEKGFEVKRSRKMKSVLSRGRPSRVFKVASGKRH